MIVDGFSYYEKRILKSGEIVWQCSTEKKCTAKLYTLANNSIVRFETAHCHEKDEEKTKKILLNQLVKRKAEDVLERPSKIINSAIAEKPDLLENLTTTDISNVRKNIYRHRRKNMPTLPKNRQEAIDKLLERQLKTVKGEDFLLHEDAHSGLVIFSCTSNLTFLNKCDKIYMDGTFKYCTKFWLQLFTIHGIENGRYVPLIFCLLPNKQEETYCILFRTIREKCLEQHLCFQPNHFVVDFERAIHNAIRVTWPNADIQGCKFHLGQAWHRKIQDLGLGKEFREGKTSDIGQWLKYTFGLSYLKSEDVGDCLAFDLVPIQPEDPRVSKFVDYLVDYYIDENAKFPPSMWARADASTENTTNACESFHSHFNACFYQVHPNIISFVEILLQCQTECYIRMASTNEKTYVSKSVLQKRKNLNKIITEYLEGSVSRFDMVKFSCYKFIPSVK